MKLQTLCLILAATGGAEAFMSSQISTKVVSSSSSSSTELQFGIPTFQPKKDDDDSSDGGDKKGEKKVGIKSLAQLITAGMGAPFLGDFEGVEEDTGKMMFSLEANNLVDEKGNSKQTSMPYFESGWVDPDDEGFKFPWQK